MPRRSLNVTEADRREVFSGKEIEFSAFYAHDEIQSVRRIAQGARVGTVFVRAEIQIPAIDLKLQWLGETHFFVRADVAQHGVFGGTTYLASRSATRP